MNEVEYIRVSALTEVETSLRCLGSNSEICKDVDQEKLAQVKAGLRDIMSSLFEAVGDLVEGDG